MFWLTKYIYIPILHENMNIKEDYEESVSIKQWSLIIIIKLTLNSTHLQYTYSTWKIRIKIIFDKITQERKSDLKNNISCLLN